MLVIFLSIDSQAELEAGDWLVSSGCVNVPMSLMRVQCPSAILHKVQVVGLYRGGYRESVWGSDLPRAWRETDGGLIVEDLARGLDPDRTGVIDVYRCCSGKSVLLRPGEVLRLRVRVIEPSRVIAACSGEDLTPAASTPA